MGNDHFGGIGTLQEMSLHAALKEWYARPGDSLETPVDGYVIDIKRGDLLIEIQTRNFSALKSKLAKLGEHHPIRLVYPIAQEKWIIRLGTDGSTPVSRRKSPRRGCQEHVFRELVRIKDLVVNPNFSLEILLTREEEMWKDDGRGSWRRKRWSISDRRLVSVVERRLFESAESYRVFLPANLPGPFTTRDLASASGQPLYLAQKMAYCLRWMGVIERCGKRGRAYLYNPAGEV